MENTAPQAPIGAGRVIQIASGAEDQLYALTEDGQIWLYEGGHRPGWEQLPPPEQRQPLEFTFLKAAKS
jgi:hypothetical protein